MGYLKFLDGFRGFLCVWIILFHYTVRFPKLFDEDSFMFSFSNGGKVGVCMFFLITGFLSVLTISKFYRDGGWKWLYNKLIRLYPAYAIACLLIFTVLFFYPLEGRTPTTLINLAKDLLMTPFVSGNIDQAHWYILALVKFYISFAIFAKFKLQDKFWFYCLVIILTVISAFVKRYVGVDSALNYYLTLIVFSFFNIQIYAGILLYKSLTEKGHYIILAIIYLAFLALKVHYFFVPVLIGLIVLAILDKPIGRVFKNFFELPIFQFLGSISFMWYLIHQNIGYMLMKAEIALGFVYDLIPYVTLVLTLIMATFLHYLFETPLNKVILYRKNDKK